MDIAPTIISQLGSDLKPGFEGIPLEDLENLTTQRDRLFTIYDDKQIVNFAVERGKYRLLNIDQRMPIK
jgi:hypothetical protein